MNSTYEDFNKVEIKIGTITVAEIIPEADKLLRLEVDCGETEKRQIISGIREFVENPEDLIGTQCPFITNIEPRKIRGYVSNGMILAAGNQDSFAFLRPHKNIPPGTIVT